MSIPFRLILSIAPLALFLAVPAAYGQGSNVFISPTTVNFGSQAVGTTSQFQLVFVENTGASPITFSLFQTSPEFSITQNDCPVAPQTLSTFNACYVYLSFTPAAVGLRTGTLTITDDALGSPQLVSLQGYGTNPAGALSFQPAVLTFGAQAVGTQSGVIYVYVTNTGTLAVTVSSFTATGDYSVVSNTCTVPVVLQPYNECFLQVLFTPSAPGVRNGGITVTSDDPTSPDTLPAFGVGLTASKSFSIDPSAINFPPTGVGSLSSGTQVTITNTGTETLNLYHANVSANFVSEYPCTGSLSPGQYCSMTVDFAPVTSGLLNGSVQVTTDAGTRSATLSGNGAPPVKLLDVTPLAVDFGAVPVGSSSSQYMVQIVNGGNVSLNLSTVTLTGDFILEGNACPFAPALLAPGANCYILIAFSPRSSGQRQGILTVSDPTSQVSQNVQLRGTGGTSLEDLTISPTVLNFGNVAQGAVSPAQSVVIVNSSASDLTISQISASQGYVFTYQNCPLLVLSPGASCTLNVSFAPKAPKSNPGAITIDYSGTGSPRKVQLTGTGEVATQQLTFSQAALVFPAEPIGSESPSQTVTIQNTGTGAVDISTVLMTGDFSNAFGFYNCSSTILLPNATCSQQVAFGPTAIGKRNGTMVVTYNGSGSPFTVSLTGTGLKPTYELAIVPSSLKFAPQLVGLTSNSLQVDVVNYGNETITLSPPPTITGNFSLTNYCSAIYPGSTCSFFITFTPTSAGTSTGTITIYDNSGSGRQTVKLTGTGYN